MPLLAVVLVLAGVLLVGATGAVPANDTNSDDEHDVGICLVGADTECNDENSSERPTGTILPVDDRPENRDDESKDDVGICLVGADTACNNETDRPAEPPAANGSNGVGICLVGVDSPCNADEYRDGDRLNDTAVDNHQRDSNDADKRPRENRTDEAGICLVGAETACNTAGNQTEDRPVESDGADDELGICVTGVESSCNGGQWSAPSTALHASPLSTPSPTFGWFSSRFVTPF